MTNTVLRGPEFGKFLSFTKAKYALSTIYCSRDDTNGENSLHPGELNPSLRVLLILREKGSNAASSTQHTTSTSGIHEPKRRRANRDAAIRCQHMPATDEFLAAASCSSRSFMRQSFRRTKALLSGPRRKFLKKLLTCLKQVPYYIYYIYIIYIYCIFLFFLLWCCCCCRCCWWCWWHRQHMAWSVRSWNPRSSMSHSPSRPLGHLGRPFGGAPMTMNLCRHDPALATCQTSVLQYAGGLEDGWVYISH